MKKLTKDEKEAIRRTISGMLGMDIEEIKEATNLELDLGFDSLDAVELVMEIEKHFSIRIDEDAAMKKCKTVKDVFKYVETILPLGE